MIDTSVVVLALKNMGHEVTDIIQVPANAGDWEFRVDGKMMTLTEVRALLEAEEGGPARVGQSNAQAGVGTEQEPEDLVG